MRRVVPLTLLGLAACGPAGGYDTATATNLFRGGTAKAGNCEFKVEDGYLNHGERWSGGIRVTSKNVGDAATHCAWNATIVVGGKNVATRHGGGGELTPGATRTDSATLKGGYLGEGHARGGWLYLGVLEGWNPTSEAPHKIADPLDSPAP